MSKRSTTSKDKGATTMTDFKFKALNDWVVEQHKLGKNYHITGVTMDDTTDIQYVEIFKMTEPAVLFNDEWIKPCYEMSYTYVILKPITKVRFGTMSIAKRDYNFLLQVERDNKLKEVLQ